MDKKTKLFDYAINGHDGWMQDKPIMSKEGYIIKQSTTQSEPLISINPRLEQELYAAMSDCSQTMRHHYCIHGLGFGW